MDQDATWYNGRPWPRRRCVRWGQAAPSRPARKGHSAPSLFGPLCSGTVAHFSCSWALVRTGHLRKFKKRWLTKWLTWCSSSFCKEQVKSAVRLGGPACPRISPSSFSLWYLSCFWATVCKTVRPMLSDRCLSCLSVSNFGVLRPNGLATTH